MARRALQAHPTSSQALRENRHQGQDMPSESLLSTAEAKHLTTYNRPYKKEVKSQVLENLVNPVIGKGEEGSGKKPLEASET